MADGGSRFGFTQNAGQAWWWLRGLYGIVPIVAGLDKFTNLLVDWSIYLWPLIPETLNIAPETFMYAVGIIEIVAGIGIWTSATRIFAFIISAWLVGIAINLVITGYYDIAVRDIGLSVGALVLGIMTPMPQDQAHRRRAGAAT